MSLFAVFKSDCSVSVSESDTFSGLSEQLADNKI